MPIRLKISHDLPHKNRYKRFFVYKLGIELTKKQGGPKSPFLNSKIKYFIKIK
jgi:hypothetical protein